MENILVDLAALPRWGLCRNWLSAALLIAAASVAGCMTLEPIPANTEPVKSYEVGETYEAAAGAPMVEITAGDHLPAWVPIRFYEPPRPFVGDQDRLPDIIPSQRWFAFAKEETGLILLGHPDFVVDRTGYAILIDDEGRPIRWHLATVDEAGRWMNRMRLDIEGEWTDEQLFIPDGTRVVGDGWRGALIFREKQGSIVRITYAVYADDEAVEPFATRELLFDVLADPVIEFRSLRIRIHDVDASHVRYEVLGDEGLYWVPNG